MNLTNIKNRGKTCLVFFLIAFVVAVACGATQAKGKENAQEKSQSPLAPTTYDPRVSLAPLVTKVAAAVVNVHTKVKARRRAPDMFGRDVPDIFEWFFGPRGPNQHPFQMPEQERRSLGSGFIIDKSGLVVTNHHVVSEADEIEVQVSDDKTYEAEVIGSDERTDVALLRLKKASNLPFVAFGDSDDLKVGDYVVAIGNPFGLDHTVTSGIVSAKERVIGAGPYDDFIQTDASINPGNSGGPLFNLRGEVVGINTAIAPQGQGIGFAIPANMAAAVIDSLRKGGKVVRGWLGVSFQPVDEELAKVFGVPEKSGVVVTSVTADSPADQAGVKSGDVLCEIQQKKIDPQGKQLRNIVAGLKPGVTVPIKIVRNKKTQILQIKIGKMPEDSDRESPALSDDAQKTKLGIEVRPLDSELKQHLGAEELEGVVVVQVEPDSAAAGVLQKGDIITDINQEKVRDLKDFEKQTKNLTKGNDILFRIFRRGAWVYLVLRL